MRRFRSTAFCGREELLFTCIKQKEKEIKKHDGSPFKFCVFVFSGLVRRPETASRRPGCRTPTWWSWGGRLSPSPPADSKSSWWTNNTVAQKAPPSTRWCCAPTRARPSPRRPGPRRMFPARSDTTANNAAPRMQSRIGAQRSRNNSFLQQLLCDGCQPAERGAGLDIQRKKKDGSPRVILEKPQRDSEIETGRERRPTVAELHFRTSHKLLIRWEDTGCSFVFFSFFWLIAQFFSVTLWKNCTLNIWFLAQTLDSTLHHQPGTCVSLRVDVTQLLVVKNTQLMWMYHDVSC